MQQVKAFLFVFLVLPVLSFAQLSAPEAEAVYGGRINWIAGYALSPTETRVLLSTESANSMFYADVDHSVNPPVFSVFQTVNDFDMNGGYGGNINDFVVDAASGYFFALYQSKIISGSVTPSTASALPYVGVRSLALYDSRLFFITIDPTTKIELHFGVVDSVSGIFSESGDSPVTVKSVSDPGLQLIRVEINPDNQYLYVFEEGMPPAIYKSSEIYNAVSSACTFSTLGSGGLETAFFSVFGIAPDGRLFAGAVHGAEPNHFKFIGYSDSDGAVWDTVSTGCGGTSGKNLAFAATAGGYCVYFGTAYSTDKGQAGTWRGLAMNGAETHPNDGAVFVDPNNPSVIYVTTDQGIGASYDYGETLFEIDEGVEAIQIKDMEMNEAKTIAWLASKSGLRRVTGYAGPGESWSTFYPNGDGSPYHSVAMVSAHPDTAFAGNSRLYKTTDGGASWNRVFTTEDASYGFSFWSIVSAVEIHPAEPDVVILGVNSPDSGIKGAVFVSEDGGTNWNRIDTGVYNTEVQDILIVEETEDSTTVYVACEYISDGTNSSYGVKTITHTNAAGIVYQNDMIGESGGHITNFGAFGLAKDSVGNIFACGANSGNEPRVYVKYADSTSWQMLPTAGLPASGTAKAITIGYTTTGEQIPYIAIAENLYNLNDSGSGWELAYSYPAGTEINMLYWDDLLVGTGTGLYGQTLGTTFIGGERKEILHNFTLMQNYPNPFNPVTRIRFNLETSARVSLKVYNVLGEQVAELVNGERPSGMQTVLFDGSQLSSGVYLYRIQVIDAASSEVFTESRKMILMK